jgi:hypothetical protein
MTALTAKSRDAGRYRVPGVYFEPQPRTPEPFVVRTDVAGFIGFEPRFRDGTTASRLLGSPPLGHAFRLDVAGFQLVLGGVRARVPAVTDFVLSEDPASIPLTDGDSIVYALAVAEKGGAFRLAVAKGTAAATRSEAAPADTAVAAAVKALFVGDGDTPAIAGRRAWQRLADVTVRRAADVVWLTVKPALSLTRCDDWQDFLLAFGDPADDGTFLAPAVRAFFANGGGRCYVATVRRPVFTDPDGLELARSDMVGAQGASETEATGLERLLLVGDVSFVDVPDLYARRVVRTVEKFKLPAPAREACFFDCSQLAPPVVVEAGRGRDESDPLFDATAVAQAQRDLLLRCIPERWRVLLLLTPPLMLDSTGRFHGPSPEQAEQWRDDLTKLGDPQALSGAALYYPWVLWQERVDALVLEMPPTPFAAGVIARRDLARGPHVAPANETVRGLVGLTQALDDDVHGRLYVPDANPAGNDVSSINVLRAFPGYGVQVWGARTLSTDTWLRYLSVRRCLSAIERRVKAALDAVVFEPHTPMLWLQVTQIALSVLLPVFDSGALRGERPDQAFYVRCDAGVNPPEDVAAGRLVCEVGVAIAAPAEFLVFRVGRREGVVEVIE